MSDSTKPVKLVDSALEIRYLRLEGLGDDATEIAEPDGCAYYREPSLDEPHAMAFACRCDPEKHGGMVA